ncbi:MAG: hypothetical protein M0C28_16400 [Candidatus Moduliflexus flocculans]|nr:hypothetical protein [Candidatus Moduliflexus flocculans]
MGISATCVARRPSAHRLLVGLPAELGVIHPLEHLARHRHFVIELRQQSVNLIAIGHTP